MVKTILKLTSVVSALAVMALATPVGATYPGQIEGGNIYRIKNLTKNADFADPASADACNELQYRVRIHNPGPSPINSVSVKATLPGGESTTHTSTVTVSAVDSMPASTSDSATVQLSSSQSLSYQNGSTQLLDSNGAVIKGLPDGITQGGGVNIGTVGVSIDQKRFVQFKAKVSCPQPPKPEVKFACEALDVNKISRTRFDFTARASVTNATVQSYVFTAKDANGNVVDTQTVTTSALSANYIFNRDVVGTYTISTVVKTNKGDAPVGPCVKQVTVEAAPVVSSEVTETPSKEIPNTGAGAIAGIFAGASALAGAGHYMFRRYIG
ncbi:MAG TPA: hypothetical protein VIK37_03015 [Candidatus Saccharimonadales bacterium]